MQIQVLYLHQSANISEDFLPVSYRWFFCSEEFHSFVLRRYQADAQYLFALDCVPPFSDFPDILIKCTKASVRQWDL